MTSKLSILLLIPDARLRDIYMSRFERDGWEVDTASNLTDAERKSVQLHPAILLIHSSLLEDVRVNFKRLRSLPTLLKTRVVVLGKYLSREQVDEALQAGADDVVIYAYLTPAILVRRMNQLIDQDL